MYVSPISTRLLRGMLMPAMRAMGRCSLALPLLVTGVLADHQHPPVAADDLALLTHRLYRRSYLHGPFRLMIQTEWLWWSGRPPLPCPRTGPPGNPPGPERASAKWQRHRADRSACYAAFPRRVSRSTRRSARRPPH